MSWVDGGGKVKIPLVSVPVLVPVEMDFPTLGLLRSC